MPPLQQRPSPATAPAPPGLLDLGDDLLERILLSLDQGQLRRCIPLVCRRLDRVQRGSQQLWRVLTLDELDDSREALHRMLAWLRHRAPHLRALTLEISTHWTDRVPALMLLSLAGHQLTSLRLEAQEEDPRSAAQLLAPLAACTSLRDLDVCVMLAEGDAPYAALPQVKARGVPRGSPAALEHAPGGIGSGRL